LSVTLSDLRTELIASDSIFNNPRFTTAVCNRMINRAYQQIMLLIPDYDSQFLTKEATLSITASQRYIDLPVDFLKEQIVQYVDSSTSRSRLRHQHKLQSLSTTATGSRPEFYCISGVNATTGRATMYIDPYSTTTQASKIAVHYFPTATELALDADVIALPDNWETVIVALAEAKMLKWAGLPWLDRMAEAKSEVQTKLDSIAKSREEPYGNPEEDAYGFSG
jgi:hypothetical protein